MNKFLVISLSVLVICLPAFARAEVQLAAPVQEPTRYSVSLATGAAYVTDRSFDLISGSDAMQVADLRVGYAPGWQQHRLELTLGYERHGASDSTYSTWQTDMLVQSLQLGFLYRRLVLERLSVYGRAAWLMDFDKLQIGEGDAAPTLQQTAHTFGLLAAAGIEAALLDAGRVHLGLAVDVGYALRFAAARFDKLTPDISGEKQAPIAFQPVDAGSLSLSGIQWRLGVTARF